MATETCRDVLAEILDRIDRHTAGGPGWVWVEPDRIRAAIAADDAERERRADRPTTLEALAAGHAAAERQLRALRAVAGATLDENCPCEMSNWLADAFAELDAADAAARGDV